MFKIILCFFIFLSSYSFSENQKCSSVFKKKISFQDIVQKTIKTGVDINIRDDQGRTFLMNAAIKGDKDLVKLLIKAEANVNARDIYGRTALNFASDRDLNKEVVKLLLEADADVNARGEDGYTALIHAAFYEHEDLVKLLLEQGADVNIKAKDGRTALSWAKKRSSESKKNLGSIVQILKQAGATE